MKISIGRQQGKSNKLESFALQNALNLPRILGQEFSSFTLCGGRIWAWYSPIRRKKSISEIVIEQTIRIEAVMVAQLVQRLLPTPSDHGSSPTSCYKHEHENKEVKYKYTKIGHLY